MNDPTFLFRPFAHGQYGSWDEILFLGLALVVFLVILGSGWVSRTPQEADDGLEAEKISAP